MYQCSQRDLRPCRLSADQLSRQARGDLGHDLRLARANRRQPHRPGQHRRDRHGWQHRPAFGGLEWHLAVCRAAGSARSEHLAAEQRGSDMQRPGGPRRSLRLGHRSRAGQGVHTHRRSEGSLQHVSEVHHGTARPEAGAGLPQHQSARTHRLHERGHQDGVRAAERNGGSVRSAAEQHRLGLPTPEQGVPQQRGADADDGAYPPSVGGRQRYDPSLVRRSKTSRCAHLCAVCPPWFV